MTGYYSIEELKNVGIRTNGNDVRISVRTGIYPDGEIEVGEHVRIDDFCVLVGNIKIGSYVHIGSHCGLHASKNGRIIFKDYSGISSNVQIYASSDDFDGEYLTAKPGLPSEMFHTESSSVTLGMYSQVGTSSVLLPGAVLGEGTAVGTMSLVRDSLKPWSVYVGVPCRYLKSRKNCFLRQLEQIKDGKALQSGFSQNS